MLHGILDSIEVSIPACHAGDPGSIPGRGVKLFVSLMKWSSGFEYNFFINQLWLILAYADCSYKKGVI